jgi:hypothetical protein
MFENKTIIHSFERRRFENQAKISPIPKKKKIEGEEENIIY